MAEALSWLTNLDKRYNMTNPNYGIGDFIEDLKTKGYLTEENQKGEFKITGKAEQSIRKNALRNLWETEKGKGGLHKTTHSGQGEEKELIGDPIPLEIIWIRLR